MEDGLRATVRAFQGAPGIVPLWLWLVVPILFYFAVVISLGIDEALHFWVVNDERGLGENLTTFWFLGVAVLSFLIFRERELFEGHWLRWCFALMSVVAFFVAGEEASWGQHFFGWGTPDWVADLNKQNETNLHNMAQKLLDQKPRAIVSIVIFLGGVVMPLLYKKNKLAFVDGYPMIKWLMPTPQLIPAALFAFLPRLPDRIQRNFDVSLGQMFDMPTRHFQEVQEFYIGLFIFLYVFALRRSLQSQS